ncbi:MAG: hypothetical protein IPL07_09865 [Acidimicrobiaceae bacterium]|nr:hypothetical protein [Acidimicrobiaceae bacterium]
MNNMGLFSKKQSPAAPKPTGRTSSAGGPSPTEILSGDSFMLSVKRKVIPPPGFAFINRFLHGNESSWSEDFAANRTAMADGAALRLSISRLGESLDEVGRAGAPLPILQALEEAVTLNLTGLVVLLAQELLDSNPGLRSQSSIARGRPNGWAESGDVSALAIFLREASRGTDASLSMRGDQFANRPGESFRCCVDVIDEIAARIRRDGIPAIDAIDISKSDAMAVNMGQMITANMVIGGRLNGP